MTKPTKHIWVTKEGKAIKVKDMTDSHLLFTQRLLRRAAQANLIEETNAAYSCLCSLQGEMAQYYCEQDISRLEETDPEDFVSSCYVTYDAISAEIKRRKLTELPV